jgi:hypothetical protein
MKRIDYPRTEKGDIDLLALFEERFCADSPPGLYPDDAITAAKQALGELELRCAVSSTQVAELAVLMAEQCVHNFAVQALLTKSLKKKAPGTPIMMMGG